MLPIDLFAVSTSNAINLKGPAGGVLRCPNLFNVFTVWALCICQNFLTQAAEPTTENPNSLGSSGSWQVVLALKVCILPYCSFTHGPDQSFTHLAVVALPPVFLTFAATAQTGRV